MKTAMDFVSLQERVAEKLRHAVSCLQEDGTITEVPKLPPVAPPKQADHGDFASTIALALAKPNKKNPRALAEGIAARLEGDPDFASVTIAGPGYINMKLAPETVQASLRAILETGSDYVRTDKGKGKKILVEFVSANPTGPLHIGHGRGAVVGDTIARLLELSGHEVTREYYINDIGHQANVLARSVWLRYRELFGHAFAEPEDFYPGEYIIDIAAELKERHGEKYVDAPEEAWLEPFREYALDYNLTRIKQHLLSFGVQFDRFQSEAALLGASDLKQVVARLEASGHVFEEDGKKWMRTTEFGDDKDRVVIRDDGRSTYFASDILYHHQKCERGFDHLINVLGADHGGYVARLKAGLKCMGHDPDALEVVLIQMVNLTRDGRPLRMGKRSGNVVWLDDVNEEVGSDPTRYFFAMRRPEAQLDFDMALATKKSLDNPVYYAQMGHARLCSIANRAREAGITDPSLDSDLSVLVLPEELELIRLMNQAPDVIAKGAADRSAHGVVHYLHELIGTFHSYYTQYKGAERVISDDAPKTAARLLLCRGLQLTVGTLLTCLGVGAPERMALDEVQAAGGDT